MRLLLLCLIAVAFAEKQLTEPQYASYWKQFQITYDKVYEDFEEAARKYNTFKDNLDTIWEHNAKSEPYWMNITEFTDMTAFEFAQFVQRGNGGGYIAVNDPKIYSDKDLESCPRIDWTTRGAVNEVKNQGNCGSCWAFSTTGSIEGRYEIAKGHLYSLSEQQLVDCSVLNSGCNGGMMDSAIMYVKRNGLCSEDDYPYTEQDGSCKSSSCTPVVKAGEVTGYTDVQQDSSALADAVCDGPVSVAIQADQAAFQFYGGGVITGNCGTQLDHGVLTVGFGTDGADAYWKIKNSWGAGWGEKGYVRICKDCNKNHGAGQCGVLMGASYPVIG